jgi:pimeloyl-ACP methyl ester carboxylesterase
MGILSSPGEAGPGAPGALLLNSGLLHRVGPNRLYVRIARALATRGFHSLRFDLSGLGDSAMPAAGDGLSIEDRAQVDILSAMRAMREKAGVERFVMMGLCSGAFMAHRASVENEDVVGCAQFDGHVYPTRGYFVRRYGPQVLQPRRWVRFIQRRAVAEAPASTGPVHDEAFAPNSITRDVFAREVSALVERGTKLLFVLTRGGLQEVNYARQLHDCVPRVDLDRHADVLYIPDSDHTLTLGRHRNVVVERAAEWMGRSFG